MCFDKFIDNSDDLTNEQKAIIKSYEEFSKKQRSIECEVEGLVYNDINNINAIVKTQMTTMPAIDAINSGLEHANPKSVLSIEQLISAIEEFKNVYDRAEDIKYANMISEILTNFDNDFIKKSEFKKLWIIVIFVILAKGGIGFYIITTVYSSFLK
ncbi:MAG: hypothetical protein IK999_13045 [Ruminococcus sp.]|nr:hypothetical protein [Ruminococcus sp.]